VLLGDAPFSSRTQNGDGGGHGYYLTTKACIERCRNDTKSTKEFSCKGKMKEESGEKRWLSRANVFLARIETTNKQSNLVISGFDTPFAKNAQGYSTSGVFME
jgi:hypothetical protein